MYPHGMEIIASKSQRSKMKPYCHISTHNAIHHQLQLQCKSRSQYLTQYIAFFPYTVHWSYHSGCIVNRKTNDTVLILKLGNGNESTNRIKLQQRRSYRGRRWFIKGADIIPKRLTGCISKSESKQTTRPSARQLGVQLHSVLLQTQQIP